MSKVFTVKLDGATQWTAPSGGGSLRWKKGQERDMVEGDYRLAYYKGARAFRVFEKQAVRAAKEDMMARSKKKKAAPAPAPAPEPEKVAAAPDLGAEPAPPLADPAPEPPAPDLPSDEELKGWLKKPLLELALEYGLDVSSDNTKTEIRAAIDKIR